MIQLPLGCFWAIEKPFDANLYFIENNFRLQKTEDLTKNHYNTFPKLWQRKYLFFGICHAISIESEKYFYFYEQIPGQLYHCDAPTIQVSKKLNKQIICFYTYEDSQSCGLKVYSKNDLIRHIESASSYSLNTNYGSLLENADTIIKATNTFNHQQLQQYIQHTINETPPSPLNVCNTPHKFYTFTR